MVLLHGIDLNAFIGKVGTILMRDSTFRLCDFQKNCVSFTNSVFFCLFSKKYSMNDAHKTLTFTVLLIFYCLIHAKRSSFRIIVYVSFLNKQPESIIRSLNLNPTAK